MKFPLDRCVDESHLQAFILQNLDKDNNLKKLLTKSKKIEWIGNEVSCGVGMQRIDIMLSFMLLY